MFKVYQSMAEIYAAGVVIGVMVGAVVAGCALFSASC
jgi:hypothetical protein